MTDDDRMRSGPPATALLDPTIVADPYAFYRDLVAQAPVWRVPGTNVVVVSSYELVNEAAGRVEDFSSHMRCLLYRNDAGLPEQLPFGEHAQETLATADPPVHALHRRTVFPELVAKRMLTLEPQIRDLARTCLTQAVDTGRADFMDAVGNVVPITVVTRLVGFRDVDPPELLPWAFDSAAMLGSTLTMTRLEELIGRIGPAHEWIRSQVSAATAEQSSDLLGTVSQGIAEGTFSVEEGVIILHTLLSAGGETTSSLLGSAVKTLAERPDLQDRLRADPGLVPAFVEEVLRLESPFRLMMRTVPAATSLGGVAIDAGSTVLLFFGAANRDPAQFERPDEIDLGREALRTHLAFGKGLHFCVGARLARLEATTVAEELLTHTRAVELDPTRPPHWVDSLLVRRLDSLPLVLIPS